jgi:hypothetical protein
MAETSGFTPSKESIIPRIIPAPTKVYTTNVGRNRSSLRFERSEWDIAETGRIVDVESIVRRAFKVKKNLFVKEGYEFVGKDINRVRYIKRRLQQMEHATGIPFPILMSQTISSLIRCSNAVWVKVRDNKSSGGKVRVTPDNKTLNPIAGYFIVPVETIRFKRDEYGRLVKYEQEIYGHNPVEFLPEDVVHFCFDKVPGFAVGTPILVPVRDDIRALRRIEENLELLLYQHLFPLFHYQVGTPEAPAATFPDGSTEVSVIQARVAQMPSDGCWVTPERHKITPLAAGQPPVAVEKVIEHFKTRIYIGLGVSSVDMGEGGTSNRSTAQTMSRNLIDDTKADQKELGAQFYSYIIQELLLESTFSQDTILDEENRVFLKFKEIDNEARQAKENHLVDVFLKNAITHDELRQEFGYEPFQGEGWPTANNKGKMFVKGDGDFAKTNYGLFDRDKVILQSIDEPGTDEAKSASKAASSKSSSPGGSSVANKNQPTNQHKTRPSAKINKDSIHRANIKSLNSVYSVGTPVSTAYRSIQKDIVELIRREGTKTSRIDFNLDIVFSEAAKRLIEQSQRAFRVGVMDTNHQPYEVNLSYADNKIEENVIRYTEKLKKQLSNRINANTTKRPELKNEDAVFVDLIFESMLHRAEMIDDSELMRAYNFGLANGFRLEGFKEMFSSGDSCCEVCKANSLKYKESDAIIYEELPPIHPRCECTIKATK